MVVMSGGKYYFFYLLFNFIRWIGRKWIFF
jgi:hypothetical protein